MSHAGLGDYTAEVELFFDDGFTEKPSVPSFDLERERNHKGAAAYFLGVEGKTAQFGCEAHNLPDPETMVGLMGHEVAHVFRHVKGLCREDRALEENLTDITTVYLGFGVFTANGSHRYSSSGEQIGGSTVTRYNHQRFGYLPAASFCFLLACQAVARGDVRQAELIAKHLESNQKGYFTDAYRDISENRETLLDLLGLA